MLSTFAASIELAVLATPGYEFIFHDEICGRIGSKLRFNVPYENARGHRVDKLLVPDRAFGIRYPDNSVRLFLVEADRSTETLSSTDTNRKTLYENDLQYREFIKTGMFRQALNTQGGVLVLNLMASERRMQNVLRNVKPANFLLFRALPAFASPYFLTPPLLTELFSEPWERPGREPFHINQK